MQLSSTSPLKATPSTDVGGNGPAKYGLCTAYAHNSDQAKQHGVAFQNLEQAASDANQSVEDYCSNATPGGK